ncbi:MAG: protein-L-isoaspartate O-methyltransferase [Alphaproteobacteria bacterium]|nr:protein-L-isoaspartate O-methyltransferase [Alphaproteobacteria bacterium]
MFDFAKARQSMVDSQLHTAGVIAPEILNAFETVPREKFVPANLKPVAYCDESLSLGKGRYLVSPMVHAKMLQAAQPQPHEIVLDVGAATGYGSAVLSPLCSTVIALESDKTMCAQIDKLCSTVGACNVIAVDGVLADGYAKHSPYDLIIVNGACADVPQSLVDQLAPEGRMLLILKPPHQKSGAVQLIKKQSGVGKNAFSAYTLFDASVPYLKGFEPKVEFVFS